MISVNDLAGWRGVQNVRLAFRDEGFLVPDAYAQTASEMCDHVFTPEEFVAECDATSVLYVSSGFDLREAWLKSGPTPIRSLFAEKLKNIGSAGRHEQLYGFLERQKVTELGNIPSDAPPLTLKKTEVRAFAEVLGGKSGYSRSKPGTTYYKGGLWKRLEPTGLVGHFAVDAGGANFPRPSGTNLHFFLGMSEPTPQDKEIYPASLLAGVEYYDLLLGAIDPYSREGARHFAPEADSRMLQLGVVALVRFFDLVLKSVNSELSH